MQGNDPKALLYKRSRFETYLPLDRLYSPTHYWLLKQEGVWRVGLTRFRTHHLGEIVDYGFDIQSGMTVRVAQVLGWIEGFKAVSDLVCAVHGKFAGSNPNLSRHTETIDRDCYGEGWLYEAIGQPDPRCLDASAYAAQLDNTIDELIKKQQQQTND